MTDEKKEQEVIMQNVASLSSRYWKISAENEQIERLIADIDVGKTITITSSSGVLLAAIEIAQSHNGRNELNGILIERIHTNLEEMNHIVTCFKSNINDEY